MKTHNHIDMIISQMDIIVAIFGFIIGIVLTFAVYPLASQILILEIGVALIIISPIYLILRKMNWVTGFDKSSPQIEKYSHNKYRVVNIIFWLLITASFIILLRSGDNRPITYFILISLAAGMVVLSLLSSDEHECKISEIIKIITLGLNIRISVFFLRSGNGGSGGDYFQHLSGNNILSETGNLDLMGLATRTMNKEISYPLMHIQTAVTDLLTNLPIKLSTFIAISVPLLISTICIYLFVKEIFDKKSAVLATLILSVTDYVILWGFGPTTTSFGLCIFYFTMYCIVKLWRKRQYKTWIIIYIILSLSMILTHAVSSYILLVTLVSFFIAFIIYNKYIPHLQLSISEGIPVLIYAILLIIFSVYASYSTSTSFFDKIGGTLVNSLNSVAGLFHTQASTVSSLGLTEPALVLFFSEIGYVILFTASIIGMYLMLNRKLISREGFHIIFAYLGLQIVTYIFPIMGLHNIIPERWFAFIWFFSSILFAFALIYIHNKNTKKTRTIITIVIIIFTFSMITGPIANDESPFISQEYRSSNSYTFKEVAAGMTLDSYVEDEELITDYYYMTQFKYKFLDLKTKYLTYDDIQQIKSGNIPMNLLNSLIVYRDEMKDRAIRIYWSNPITNRTVIIKVPFGLDFKKHLEKYSAVYDIGQVTAYNI